MVSQQCLVGPFRSYIYLKMKRIRCLIRIRSGEPGLVDSSGWPINRVGRSLLI